MNNSTKNNKIDSLQALRTIAFLGIFFSHSTFFIKWPKLGVSVFFVLSGFLMMYTYEQKEFSLSLKNNISFSLNKIKKLYPLHIITMLFAIALNIFILLRFGYTADSIKTLIMEIALNLTLMQSWYPDTIINSSLNGVAWYLSTTMFLYFMFPYIQKLIKKSRLLLLWSACILLILAEILSDIFFINRFGMGSPLEIWSVYCFPIARLIDFFCGCCLGKTYLSLNNKKTGTAIYTLLEIVATALTVAAFLWLKNVQSNILLQALQNWTTIYIPLAIIWVFLFARCKGLLTKLLSNKLFIYIGNISSFAFLIHYVITQYTIIGLGVLKLELLGKKKAVLIFMELLITILISILYKKISTKKAR